MLQTQEVRQTEMGKATSSLFYAIDVLTERVDVKVRITIEEIKNNRITEGKR